jgi:hypothetical protein
MVTLLLSLVSRFWPFLVALVGVASVLGMLYSYGNGKYKAGFADADKGRIACETSYKIEHASWVATVQRQALELDALAKRKQEVIVKTVTKYKEVIKEVEVNKKETSDEIKVTIKPNDVVIVPSAFVSVYNRAIEGSRIATGQADSTRTEDARSSSGTIGQTTIFDATTFAEVVKGNVDTYNEIAARLDRLQELVKEIEKMNNE